MSAQIEYNQMPSEPAPAVLSGQKVNAEQPRPNQPMTMDQTTHLRGGEAGVSRHLPPSKAHRALRHDPPYLQP
ncbi:hypothetical protein LY76DRAFT_514958 [Colletotrichum caudatum]|nr:hypothetical protein LY76DRAFT_514958 [Colletotrichum caudatum]